MNERISQRLMSIDALRGFDMFFIMGGAALVISLCTALGCGEQCALVMQMRHVPWEGFHHHDTIFPLFLFLAGVSWPFSLASQRARGRTTAQVIRKVLMRMAALVFLGLAASALFSLEVAKYRYDSVLAHIGVCWAGAAILSVFVESWRWRLAVALAMLVGHWALVYFIPAPDIAEVLASTDPAIVKKVAQYSALGTGAFSPVGSFACWMDRMFEPGVLNEKIFNADGLLAKVTGMTLAIFGTLAGELLKAKTLSGNRKTVILLSAALVAYLVLLVWKPFCPIVKKIWTPTFVLASATYALAVLAIFYWLIDVKGWRRWSLAFCVIGMNSITIYMAQRFIDFGKVANFFLCGCVRLAGAPWGVVISRAGYIVACWLFLYFLYRKNVFLKV